MREDNFRQLIHDAANGPYLDNIADLPNGRYRLTMDIMILAEDEGMYNLKVQRTGWGGIFAKTFGKKK